MGTLLHDYAVPETCTLRAARGASSMTILLVTCLAFLITHLGISATPLRGALIGAMGETAYLVAYSLMSFVTLGAMIYAYAVIPHGTFLWSPTPTAYLIAKVIMMFALVLLSMGIMTRNPTAVKMESAVNDELRGVLKITRHPIQWAIILYVISHLIANGDEASVVFFGTLGLMSVLGTISMDARKRRGEEPGWATFFATTSNIPFVALATRRTRIAAGDISYLAIGIGLALYVIIYWLHDMVSGGQSLF